MSAATSENGGAGHEGPRARQLTVVTKKALDNIHKAAGGTYFRSFLAGIELNASRERAAAVTAAKVAARGRDASVPGTAGDATEGYASTATAAAARRPRRRKRRMQPDEKDQVDQVAASLLVEVCEQVDTEFERHVQRAGFRTKLNELDRLLAEQPLLPGSGGERAPPVLTEDPASLVRAKRMKLKAVDKANLERLLAEAQEVNAQLTEELKAEQELAQRCEKDLDEKASVISAAYNSIQPSALP